MSAVPESIGPYHYKPQSLIRETRMSLVWAAVVNKQAKVQAGDDVVLKVARMSEKNYSLTNQQAIENEEKWLRQLNHPGIIKLRSIAEQSSSAREVYRARTNLEDNPWFLAMDFLPGGTLGGLVNQARTSQRFGLSARLALQISRSIALALVHAHQKDCVHRDIKPNNILFRTPPSGDDLTAETQPVLIDFGIAAVKGKDGRVVGTRAWMAPEAEDAMRNGKDMKADPSWDIYALGLVLYFMLTGDRPPSGVPHVPHAVQLGPHVLENDETVAKQQADTLLKELNKLIQKSVANRQEARPTAQEFAQIAEKLLALTSSPKIGIISVPKRPKRGFVGWFLGAATVAAMIGAGIFLWLNLGTVQPPPSVTSIPATATVAGIAPGETLTATPESTDTPDDGNNGEGAVTGPATDESTATPVETITRQPLSASTDTPTVSPIATPKDTSTATPTDRPADGPTVIDTTVPTSTPTETTAGPTSTPIDTFTPVITVTPSDTPTPTPLQATDTPTVADTGANIGAAPANRQVTILEPVQDRTGRGRIRFAWEPANFERLRPGEMYEILFWLEGTETLAEHGRPVVGASTETSQDINFDSGTGLEEFRKYNWTIFIVTGTGENYRRIQQVSEVRQFTYQR